METRKTKFFHILICVVFLLAVMPMSTYASQYETQQGAVTIKGTVTDKQGEALIGVSVSVKGTTQGTLTDLDGGYSIDVAPGATLSFIYVGYTPQNVTVGSDRTINIVLEEDNQVLEEVVVVGYGVQKKVNLTGSVSAISNKELESRPITNVSSALGGLAAGVQVSQTSGHPSDDGAKIRVRGTGTLNNSDALIIIDGIVSETMDALNPQDIENISILKDAASSAIYGSRAANGVVLVTTKKGSRGKNVISFGATLSIAEPTKRNKFITDYADYMRLMNESYENVGNTRPLFPDSDIEAWEYAKAHPNELNDAGYPLWAVYPNVDQAKEALERNVIQSYNIGASGGTDKLNYNLSLGYLNNPGIMSNTGIERYQGRINIDSKLTNFLTVGTQTFFSTQDNDIGNVKDAFNYFRQSTPGYLGKPYDGKLQYPSSDSESSMANLAYDWLNRKDGNDRVNRLNTTWYARFDLLKGLTLESKVNYQRMNREKNDYPTPFERWNFSTGLLVTPIPSPETFESTYSYEKEYTITTDNVLRYITTINKDHDIAALVGHNEYYFNHNEYSATMKGLVDKDLHRFNNANEVLKASGTEWDNAMRSFFGRVNYAYKSKYLLEANVRYDGSSRFSKDSRWGSFPSFSGAWRISEEDFVGERFKEIFQNMKLRASWGKLGNSVTQRKDKDKFYAYMNSYTNIADSDTGNNGTYYSFNGKPVTGMVVRDLGNIDLKWETTRVLDFALEFTTLNGRASFEFDYYDRYTDGILFPPSLSSVLGWKNAPIMNLAEVSNRGFEITANWRDNIGDFSYSVGANVSYNKNRVEKYKGSFTQGWVTDDSGKQVWKSNFDQAATSVNNDDNKGYIVEGQEIGVQYVRKLHSGRGDYFNSDGSVNINGGPSDGMIRTEEDMKWVQAMKAAGYKFSPQNTVGSPTSKKQLYYGDFIYADLNGDGIYGDSYDRDFIKASTMPKWNLGINLNAAYKGFDFSMIWSGSFGGKIYGQNAGIYGNQTYTGSQIPKLVADDHYYYDPENPSDSRTNIYGKFPRLKWDGDNTNTQRSEFWIHSTSYLRMKNIQLGYTLPKSITSKFGAGLVRFYISGENLLTISSFEGIDPETQQMSQYPTLKQMAFGLNVNF